MVSYLRSATKGPTPETQLLPCRVCPHTEIQPLKFCWYVMLFHLTPLNLLEFTNVSEFNKNSVIPVKKKKKKTHKGKVYFPQTQAQRWHLQCCCDGGLGSRESEAAMEEAGIKETLNGGVAFKASEL